ncbi:hypothetical protein [Nonomuraea turcica]|uniref:hypothetical protein n=1 Tax=Nonomuraea sp. G32 TaxID=3067274 RepID=UPI00273C6D16|nr:hypothetical protein [Nonomuraea sp. G32]MDP4511738.1 hypothetical protein [Nonomuraea sp. G32]
MADSAAQPGIAILALTTRRPPDRARGNGVVHLELTLPAAVAAQLALDDASQRPRLTPREAARLLWSSPAAAHLDGSDDGWHGIAHVPMLLDAVHRLRGLPTDKWPGNQQQLRAFTVSGSQPAITATGLLTALRRNATIEHLNDVFLILKYAAVGRRRRLGDAADVYRLARTIVGPAASLGKVEQVRAWLKAPLIVPRILAGPQRQRPPGPPPGATDADGTGESRDLVIPVIDLETAAARAAIAATQRLLAAIDRVGEAVTSLRRLTQAVTPPGWPDPPVAGSWTGRSATTSGTAAPDSGSATPVGGFAAAGRSGASLTDPTVEHGWGEGLLAAPDLQVSENAVAESVVAAAVAAAAAGPAAAARAITRLQAQQRALLARLYRQQPRRQAGTVRTLIAGNPVLIDVVQADARVRRRRAQLAAALAEQLPQDLHARLKALNVPWEDLWFWPDLLRANSRSPSYLEPAGRSDLLLIRQTTTGYRRAEISYIENVLIGECRTREHTDRILNRQETFVALEQESEESRDLQTTDRAELAREVSEVVREDLRAEGSVQVTSRGATKIVAEASVSFDQSTEVAARTAEQYARETIERAVRRTVERVRRETRSLFERETTERNQHGFQLDGTAPDHVSGVYQYLVQVSRAKIFSYGERELYDLLVPEPAALIWHLAVTRTDLHVPVERPDANLFASLTLDNIADHREEVIRSFGVFDLPELPPQFRLLSAVFTATGGGDGAHYANSKDLQIPDGYGVESARLAVSAETEGDEDYTPNGGAVVGGGVHLWDTPLQGNAGSHTHEFDFIPLLPGPSLLIAFNADNYRSLIASVTVRLRLTDQGQRAWALEAYARVADRYQQMSREYEQAIIQATAAQPEELITLPEGSRLRLQQIVRTEVQRSVIDIMRNAAVDFDLIADHWFADAGERIAHPTADLGALGSVEPEVRFLQQAFEWEHMSWVMYPYFWGRRTEWTRTVVQAHPDPDFAAFLDAGAARVQVPVRLGFEHLVKHFMETSEPYDGGDMPMTGEPGYVTFIDEQLTALGAPGAEVPWPPGAAREWDVVAPTSLLLVRPQTMPQLPAWNPADGTETA